MFPHLLFLFLAVDSCDNPIKAAEKALPLLKGFLRRKVGFAPTPCNNSNDLWNCGDNIVGVVGPQTSGQYQMSNCSGPAHACPRPQFPIPIILCNS